ncbi:uncharacterized protein LOC141601380 [Silene latifolia]|uniref:uncharacterized protein LOC141601380 n=1 Tax=Silene latifolia TaxID=37657 RepID=UPI003D7743F4
MDIEGPLPRASGNRTYMLAMMNYFPKWIEAEAFPQILEKHVISFIKRNIVSRYDIPSKIICDNESQFISNRTEGYYAKWNIKLFKSTPRNPQSNGQAESSYKIVMNNLKRRLEHIGANWADELPFVLWSDRTTQKWQQVKHHSVWYMGPRQLFPLRYKYRRIDMPMPPKRGTR